VDQEVQAMELQDLETPPMELLETPPMQLLLLKVVPEFL